jgi:hypothetical protein
MTVRRDFQFWPRGMGAGVEQAFPGPPIDIDELEQNTVQSDSYRPCIALTSSSDMVGRRTVLRLKTGADFHLALLCLR